MLRECSQRLPAKAALRKSLLRQTALTEDLSDGPLVTNEFIQTRSNVQPGNADLKSSYSSKRDSPNLKTQKSVPELQSPQLDRRTPSEQSQPLKRLLARYTKGLASYEQELIKRRSVQYDQADPRKETHHHDRAKFLKPDVHVSEGHPPTSEALPAGSSKRTASVCLRDLSDAPPSDEVCVRQSQQATQSEKVENATKKCPSTSDFGSLTDDDLEEGPRESLSGIQEKRGLDSCGCDTGTETSSADKNSLSVSGQQKSEGFRQSKKSSGYGTSGGSEDKDPGPDDVEDYSSVFLPAQISNNKDATAGSLHIPCQDPRSFHVPTESQKWSSTSGLRDLTLHSLCADRVAHGEATHASTNGRLVECRDASLSPSANIWQMNYTVNIPSDIRRKAQELENQAQCDDLIMGIIEANPQIPFPRDDLLCPLISGNHRQELDNIELAIESAQELSSQSWAECTSSEPLHSSTIIDLQISDQSVSSSSFRGQNGLDEVDCRSSAASSAERRTPPCQRPANGYAHLGPVANGYAHLGPVANGYTHPGLMSHSASGWSPPDDRRVNGYGTNGATGLDEVGTRPVSREGRGGGFTGLLRAKGIRGADGRTKDVEAGRKRETVAMTTASQQPLTNGHAKPSSKDSNHVHGSPYQAHFHNVGLLSRNLGLAIYCRNKFCIQDVACCLGKRHLLELEDLFLQDKLRHAASTLRYLWQHSRHCPEIDCAVPFCSVFRKRPNAPFDVQFASMTASSLQRELQLELVHLLQKQLHLGSFLQLSPSDRISHATWTKARLVKQRFLGHFGDFNILRGQFALPGSSSLDVVIKKATAYKDLQHVYFQIGKVSSPYIAQNYWLCEVSEDTLLVCSVYYSDLVSLDNLPPDRSLTRSLTLLHQVVLAAQYLHSLAPSIIYLNWKCSNALWDGKNIKLCNFSKAIQIQPGIVTRCPASIRLSIDPRFTAPEVLCGEALGFYSDIWGIGCLFYELLTQSPPYPDYCHRAPADIRDMLRSDRIDRTFPNDDSILILCHCWERTPANRWPVQGLLDTLEECLSVRSDAER